MIPLSRSSSSDLLHTVTDYQQDFAVVAIFGELDISNVDLARSAVTNALARQPVRLVLDLTDVRFIGSHGIALLMQARALSHNSGIAFYLRGATKGRVGFALRTLGLIPLFEHLNPTSPRNGPAAQRPPPAEQ